MPLYVYLCEKCGFSCDEFNTIERRHFGPQHCGEKMKLDVTGPAVHADLEPYFDDNLETYIKSRQHHKQVMREKEVYDKREFKGHRWRN